MIKTKLSRQKQEAEKQARALNLRQLPYREYLKTTYWQKRRHFALVRSGNRCQVCNSAKQPLNVHHRSYMHLGMEPHNDLTVLCADCHHLFHRHGRLA